MLVVKHIYEHNHDKDCVIRNFKGTCSSIEMLKGYMLIRRNAEGVHGKKKVGNPCSVETSLTTGADPAEAIAPLKPAKVTYSP